jgi:SAM-dependent methyltransferase
MAVAEVTAFVRANLPATPARVLEIGAGKGELAYALSDAGYDVVAIDPEPAGTNVRACALHELDEARASFDAAVAVVSLHHVDPLADSLRRLAEVLKPSGVLLVDEFDVHAFDRRSAEWWLEQRRALGVDEQHTADELVEEHRTHLHPLETITQALEPHFHVNAPLRMPYLYRWDLGESFRRLEEGLIARGQLTAVGARFLAYRRT